MQEGQRTVMVVVEPDRLDRYRRNLTGARRALGRNPNMAAGLFILVFVSVLAIFAVQIGNVGGRHPNQTQAMVRLSSPSGEFWFGTDAVGRDIYARAIHGSRLSLRVGASVAAITVVAGAIFGILTGYYKRLDDVIMRFMDGLMAIPGFILALSLVALLGPSVKNVVIAIAIADTPGLVRIVRSSVLSLREQQFIDAANAIGASELRILVRHIFPQLVGPLIVQGTFIFAIAILSEAGLSFLGVGVPPNIPSWGNMMGENRLYMQVAVWTLFFPGLFIAFTVLGVNLLGDGLRDNLDPRLRRRM